MCLPRSLSRRTPANKRRRPRVDPDTRGTRAPTSIIQEDQNAHKAAAPWAALHLQFQKPPQERAVPTATAAAAIGDMSRYTSPLTAHEQMHMQRTSKQTVGSGRMPFNDRKRKNAPVGDVRSQPQQVDASAEGISRNVTVMGSLSSLHGGFGGGMGGVPGGVAAETSSEDLMMLTRDYRNMGLVDPSEVLRLLSVSDDSGLRRVSTARLDGALCGAAVCSVCVCRSRSWCSLVRYSLVACTCAPLVQSASCTRSRSRGIHA